MFRLLLLVASGSHVNYTLTGFRLSQESSFIDGKFEFSITLLHKPLSLCEAKGTLKTKKIPIMTYHRDKTKTEAFADLGAKTLNRMNEYSAIAKDGAIVLECWNQHIGSLADGTWRYQLNDLSSWTNSHGKNLMLEHLGLAVNEGRPIRLIIVRLKKDPNADIAGIDASNEPKVIIPYHDRIGQVVELTRNNLIIDFRKVGR